MSFSQFSNDGFFQTAAELLALLFKRRWIAKKLLHFQNKLFQQVFLMCSRCIVDVCHKKLTRSNFVKVKREVLKNKFIGLDFVDLYLYMWKNWFKCIISSSIEHRIHMSLEVCMIIIFTHLTIIKMQLDDFTILNKKNWYCQPGLQTLALKCRNWLRTIPKMVKQWL